MCGFQHLLYNLGTLLDAGTSQMGCILWKIARTKGLVQPWYYNPSANSSVIASYLERSKDGTAPATFLTGSHLQTQCFHSQTHLPCGAHGMSDCPCDLAPRDCLSLEDACHLILPVANIRGLHFIRHPVDIILSAYAYHVQLPAPEEYFEQLLTSDIVRQLADHGGDSDVLTRLLPDKTNLTFGEAIRTLPIKAGLQLVFWMSAKNLYAMVRQHRLLQNRLPTVMAVRFESLRDDFNGTVGKFLVNLGLGYSPSDTLHAVEQLQHCDPGTWDTAKLKTSNHVTLASEGDRAGERARLLLADGEVQRRLCDMAAALGYGHDHPASQLCHSKAQ